MMGVTQQNQVFIASTRLIVAVRVESLSAAASSFDITNLCDEKIVTIYQRMSTAWKRALVA